MSALGLIYSWIRYTSILYYCSFSTFASVKFSTYGADWPNQVKEIHLFNCVIRCLSPGIAENSVWLGAQLAQGLKSLCVDLSCDHSSSTSKLSSYFIKVLGVDPSGLIVKQTTSSTIEVNVSFIQGNFEDLDSFADGSTGMVISSQGAH
jgi:hypothetical protein